MQSAGSRALPAELAAMPQPLFVFDGVCVLCSNAVRFVLRRERDTALCFASAQSPMGQAVLQALHLPLQEFATLVVLERGQAHVKSAAVLSLAGRLRQPWRLLGRIAGLLPAPLLDWLYDRVAQNRYRLFGRYDSCRVPDAALGARFVDGTGSSQPR